MRNVIDEAGVVAEGSPFFVSFGEPVAVDGSLVTCGCPSGSNRVVAPMSGPFPSGRGMGETPASQPTAMTRSALEPGFHIVQRSMSFDEVLASLEMSHAPLPLSLLKRLNPTHAQGFKAGEIFVLGSPDSEFACGPGETELIMVAEKARESLATLSKEEADFMMRHIGEIAGVLNGASQSMGVGKDMLERGLGQVKDTLKGIEALHQQQFTLHGHLKSAEFFAKRKELYQHLSAQLRVGFLNKTLSLGSYDSLRRNLGISTKSLVHHWKKAGIPGQIPGYATHLDEVAKMSNYLKYGGYAAIGLGAGSSYLKIKAACKAGESEACKKIRLTEAGSFSGGLIGGAAGGWLMSNTVSAVCTLTPHGRVVCGVVMIGGGSFTFSKAGESLGEWIGEVIYETWYD